MVIWFASALLQLFVAAQPPDFNGPLGILPPDATLQAVTRVMVTGASQHDCQFALARLASVRLSRVLVEVECSPIAVQ